MPNSSDKPTVTLEALLKVKREERPAPEFWDSFENTFHQRRLHALMGQPSRFERVAWPAFKTLALALPVLAFAGMALVWSRMPEPSGAAVSRTQTAPLPVVASAAAARETVAETPVERSPEVPVLARGITSSQFVLDAIEDSSSRSLDFHRVLYTPAIRLSAPSGLSYVNDSMSSRHYRVTTADLQLGRNF